jgi:hypothetical protein
VAASIAPTRPQRLWSTPRLTCAPSSGFTGIVDPEVIVAEGVAVGPDYSEAAIADGERRIAEPAA